MATRAAPWLALAAGLLMASPARGMRVIGVEVLRDGHPFLKGSTGDNGRRGAHHVWRDLAVVALRPDRDAAGPVVVEPDEPGGPVATLRGKFTLKVGYGPTADVEGLRLVRCRDFPDAWSVDPAEVERLAKGLGLPDVTEADRQLAEDRPDAFREVETPIPAPPPPASPYADVPAWRLAAGGSVLVAAVAGLALLRTATARRKDRPRDDPGA